MKKLLAFGLAATLSVAGMGVLAGCTESGDDSGEGSITVGLIALHDSNSTYDKNFIDAMQEACDNKGVELLIRTGIPENQTCYDTASDLVDQGCDVIFADSFGHEDFVLQAARENPDVQFCHATGTKAHTEGVANFHNAFASIYEGRYLAGVAAGMKLVEMYEAGKLQANNYDADGNIKIGYVGAYPYAEVVSGYTSFYLGAKSVCPTVTMEVRYTSSWYDEAAEKSTAEALIKSGCVLISQHADSMGAPTACEEAGVPNVTYNLATGAQCPNTYLVGSRINWTPYYTYLVECMRNGTEIADDWTGTFATDSVKVLEFGAGVSQAAKDAVAAAEAALKAGTLKVFDCSTFTVDGEMLTEYTADVHPDPDPTKPIPDTQVIKTENGVTYFAESADGFRSAPYFDVRIDGITEINN